MLDRRSYLLTFSCRLVGAAYAAHMRLGWPSGRLLSCTRRGILAPAQLPWPCCHRCSSTAAANELRQLMRRVAQPVAVITANLHKASEIDSPGEREKQEAPK